eukprot:gnl/TRDRNA2_/TRDRNA2_30362_c0_seq1.p1 gnl/TRDRNA2_/TRDRNA2_30362_c0~~gnl/TRDRNA2_/TRDRNA2_30362_c0_seq1.p1  ORF type:complete len:494 (+),score=68.40 gnl/TRDRNA2_/TRDRNA2_30362_c0_seq1:46-1482(+)
MDPHIMMYEGFAHAYHNYGAPPFPIESPSMIRNGIEAKLDVACEGLMRQQAYIDELRTGHAALLRCLLHSGLLSVNKFSIEHHRQRSALVTRRHPCERSATLHTAMMHEECIRIILQFIDVPTSHNLSIASSKSHTALHLPGRIYVVSGVSETRKALTTVDRLDVSSANWEHVAPVPRARTRSASASAGGKLYIMGGLFGQQALDSVDCLNLYNAKWEMLPSMPVRRAGAAGAAAAKVVYTLGGSSNGFSILDTVDRYDVAEKYWSPAPPMASPRVALQAVIMQGRLFALGGNNGRQTLASVEVLDFQTQVWQQSKPLRMPRSEFTATVLPGRIVVIGGFVDGHRLLGSVDCFMPETGSWEALPPLLHPLASCTSVVCGGQIYVLGGSDGNKVHSTVQCFRLGEACWTLGPPMQVPRFATMAAACTGSADRIRGKGSWRYGGGRRMQRMDLSGAASSDSSCASAACSIGSSATVFEVY